MSEYLGRSGYVGGYRVVVSEARVRVLKGGAVVADCPAPPRNGASITRFLAEAADARLGWGRLPTGDEVVALFDGDRPRHGFAINLSDPALSGWGEIPTPLTSVAVGDAGTGHD